MTNDRPPPSSAPPSSEPPRIHAVTVLHNDAQWIESCLASVFAQTLAPWKVSVIDNASVDAGSQIVRDYFPQATLMHSPINLGFAGGNNRATAAERIEPDYIFFFNPDTVLSITAFENMAWAFRKHSKAGLMGCKLLERDVETIQHVGMELRGNGLTRVIGRGERDEGQYEGVFDVDCVSGSAFAIRNSLWHELGGFDENFWPAYYETADLCNRVKKAGWVVGVCCDVTVTHFSAAAARRRDPGHLEMFFRGRGRFLRKHYSPMAFLLRYLPDELRWMREWESRGMRRIALRGLFNAKNPRRG